MKWGYGTMRRMLVAIAATVLLVQPATAQRRDRSLEDQLRAHIEVLASDEFEGREPGTEGEAKTLRYLGKQWFDMGLVSGTNSPASEWFMPITLVAREPAASTIQFSRRGRNYFLQSAAGLMFTSGKRSLVRNAPVLFVGRADKTLPGRNELAGRVALILDGEGNSSERQDALLEAGAAAVITVLDGERSLAEIAARRQRSGYALASDVLGGDLEGFITSSALTRVLSLQVSALEAEADKPGFVPRLVDATVSLEATTRETTIRTHNLIGKISGRRPESGAVLFVAHWDHFGICGEAPAEDIICNGAIDNASGLASLTEIARRLVKGPRMDRDIYFLATTAEELGLLGAHAFAENPPIPLSQIVAAFNLDSVALAPAGSAVAIVGKGMTPFDDEIAQVVRRQKRKLVDSDSANAYVRRQDGWALLQHDIPAVMVSSAYADLGRIEGFFDGDYHRPGDGTAGKTIELGGAAEDVALHVALARWFADPKNVPARVK